MWIVNFYYCHKILAKYKAKELEHEKETRTRTFNSLCLGLVNQCPKILPCE